MKVKSKLWLEKDDDLVFGEGKSEILKAIAETGSLNRACRKMGISFRHGWGYVNAVEKRLGYRLIERSKGGRGGGGSCLTPAAEELIKKFDCLKSAGDKFIDDKFREIFGD